MALVLSGCSSGVAATPSQGASSLVTVSEDQQLTVTETCREITTGGRGSLLLRVSEHAHAVYDTGTVDRVHYQNALALVEEIDRVEKIAHPQMKEQLEEVRRGPEELISAVESNEESFTSSYEDEDDAVMGFAKTCLAGDELANVEKALTAATESSDKTFIAEPAPEDSSPTAIADPFATEMKAEFPGYPVLVDSKSLDYRVENWLEMSRNDQAVALAPGVYAPYNENIKDLESYYESGPFYGDSAMIDKYFDNGGGASWGGVKPGSQEP